MMIPTRLLLSLFALFGLQLTLANVPDFPKSLKIITEGSSTPNDVTKFTIEHSHSRVDYIFKPGANCTEIRFGDSRLWRTQERSVKHPTSITYVTDINQFAVRNELKSLIYTQGHAADWQLAYIVDNETGRVLEIPNGEVWKNRFVKVLIVVFFISLLFLLNPFILGILIYQVKVVRDIRNYVNTGPDASLLV